MTVKSSVKTNFGNKKENKDTIVPLQLLRICSRKKFNFATFVEGPSTQKLKECIKNISNNDDILFAYATNMTEVFDMVGNLKNKEIV